MCLAQSQFKVHNQNFWLQMLQKVMYIIYIIDIDHVIHNRWNHPDSRYWQMNGFCPNPCSFAIFTSLRLSGLLQGASARAQWLGLLPQLPLRHRSRCHTSTAARQAASHWASAWKRLRLPPGPRAGPGTGGQRATVACPGSEGHCHTWFGCYRTWLGLQWWYRTRA